MEGAAEEAFEEAAAAAVTAATTAAGRGTISATGVVAVGVLVPEDEGEMRLDDAEPNMGIARSADLRTASVRGSAGGVDCRGLDVREGRGLSVGLVDGLFLRLGGRTSCPPAGRGPSSSLGEATGEADELDLGLPPTRRLRDSTSLASGDEPAGGTICATTGVLLSGVGGWT